MSRRQSQKASYRDGLDLSVCPVPANHHSKKATKKVTAVVRRISSAACLAHLGRSEGLDRPMVLRCCKVFDAMQNMLPAGHETKQQHCIKSQQLLCLCAAVNSSVDGPSGAH